MLAGPFMSRMRFNIYDKNEKNKKSYRPHSWLHFYLFEFFCSGCMFMDILSLSPKRMLCNSIFQLIIYLTNLSLFRMCFLLQNKNSKRWQKLIKNINNKLLTMTDEALLCFYFFFLFYRSAWFFFFFFWMEEFKSIFAWVYYFMNISFSFVTFGIR